ncbi:uncharacterized protein PHALS_09838 [Plasmopara halstedii]|uniref:Uncharacterized protein n=1 Tax=Plasmopara halstedii TaxID=4781 RepID=A0A0P1AF25_PLAHL|nr:uncharacterized protein PHALS_09838 [Plasmopara halstedii]CEG39600.1 hypothetical protein PHALS_09838 [Plasmopara halstedii]|eukprot:XP_024575969.1 hypothetical protein PHALS_09838 [Plasmopara halstedii]
MRPWLTRRLLPGLPAQIRATTNISNCTLAVVRNIADNLGLSYCNKILTYSPTYSLILVSSTFITKN